MAKLPWDEWVNGRNSECAKRRKSEMEKRRFCETVMASAWDFSLRGMSGSVGERTKRRVGEIASERNCERAKWRKVKLQPATSNQQPATNNEQ